MTLTLSRVLITGAGGFVPRCIAASLMRRGVQVIALDQAFDDALRADWKQFNGLVTWVQGSAHNLPDVQVDAVVHGAAITASPEELNQTERENLLANVQPTLAVVEWAKSHVTGRTILMSSSAVYSAHSDRVTEDMLPTPAGTYAIAKTFTEVLADGLFSMNAQDICCVRLSSVYGLDEIARPSRPRTSMVGRYLSQALRERRIDLLNADDRRDWTFAPDIGEAIVALLEQPKLEYALFNVASEQVYSNRQIALEIQRQLPQVNIHIHDAVDITLPPLTRRGYLSHERLESATGFNEWTPFEEGLARVIKARLRQSEIVS